MPSVFARLDVAFEGDQLSVDLGGQIGKLTDLATTVAGLIQNPPSSLGDIAGSLKTLPLPDLEGGSDFAGTLAGLEDVVPTDLTSVTGDVTTKLGELQTGIQTGLAQLDKALEAVQAVYRLTQIDFRCAKSLGGEASGTAAAGGDAAAGGGGDAAATDTTQPGLASTSAAVDRVDGALGRLPSPLDVESLMAWLSGEQGLQSRLIPVTVPIFGDLKDVLDTLGRWQQLSGAELAAELRAGLDGAGALLTGRLDLVLGALVNELAAAEAQLQAPDLARIADDLTARLGELATAVEAGSLGGAGAAVSAVSGLLDELDGLRPGLQSNVLDSLTDLRARLQGLPDDLEDVMDQVLSALQPNGPIGNLEPFAQLPDLTAAEEALAELRSFLDSTAGWIQDLLAKLDLSALQQPLGAVADGAKTALDGLDAALAAVTVQVQALFGQLESMLDQVDTTAVTGQIETAIESFRDELIGQLQGLFAPAREAVSAVVGQIDGAVGEFDPEEIIASLEGAIQKVTDVLGHDEVKGAIEQIKETLESVARQIDELSFTPVTDEVVDAIGDIETALAAINPDLLTTPLQLALQGAVAILPDELTPITDPLVDELDEIMDGGPTDLVETVRRQPARLLEKVREFEPEKLIGDKLSKPYQELLEGMRGFQPSSLLGEVDDELDKLKTRLKQSADPAAALQVLDKPFQDLLGAFDQLKPDALVKPLEEAIKTAVDGLLDALPVDEVFDQVDGVLEPVQDVVGLGDKVVALLEKAQGLLGGLENSAQQLDTWISGLLDKAAAAVDDASLAAALGDLRTAIDASKAAAISSRFAATDSLATALTQLDPGGRLAALATARNAITDAAVAALPASPQKTALQAALVRLTPLDPAFAAPYHGLAGLATDLEAARTGLAAAVADWDARYHASGGLLAELTGAELTGAGLKELLLSELEPLFTRPMKLFLSLLDAVSSLVNSVLTPLKELLTTAKDKVAALLTGPQSLGAIRDSLKAIEDRLREIDLEFLKESLESLFGQVRGKLEALSPAQLAAPLTSALDEALAALSVELIFPQAELQQLDDSFTAVVTKLEQLDPGKLIDPLQEAFDEDVVPLLEAFDLTEVFDSVAEKMDELPDELREELLRVDEAYQKMLDAVPEIDLLGISLDVDIDVDIGGIGF